MLQMLNLLVQIVHFMEINHISIFDEMDRLLSSFGLQGGEVSRSLPLLN